MKSWLQVAAISMCLGASAASAQAQAPTITTLAVTLSGSPVTAVDPGTAITLTATVTSGGAPVTPGQVDFCDASVSWCTDVHLLGMAQLTASGTATFKYIPSIGVHQIKAVFLGTHAYAGGSSTVSTLTVVGTQLPWSYATQYPFVILPTDPNPQADVVADFNGDGKPDLAVAIGGAAAPASSVDVFLGNGDGTFNAAPAVPSTNAAAGSIVAGDFNDDGKQDLAIALPGVNQIQILLGNGDGTFTLGQNIQETGSPTQVITGDFNGDGIADLAVVNPGENNIVILLGKGDGTFTQAAQSPTFAATPVAAVVGDFNGDGTADLAVALDGAGSTDPGSVTILLGNGDGTFTPVPQTLSTAGSPTSITAVDFTGNGILDLAVANLNGSYLNYPTITVFKGSGNGTFSLLPDQLLYLATNYITFGDVENTGVPDLFVPIVGNEEVYAYIQQQNDGLFNTALEGWSVGNIDCPFIAVGDFNSDGFADFAAVLPTASSVIVFTSDIYGNSTQIATTTTLTAVPTSLTVGQSLTLTATVTAASGPTPTGIVYFLNGINILGTATLNSNGVATLTLQPGAGAYSIDANYTGSSTDAPSVSEPPIAVNVGSLVSTSTSLQASATTVGLGQPVTLAATVTAAGGGIPGGSVTFFDGAAPLGTGTLNAQGIATIQTSLLPLGANSITAAYPGSGEFAASTSPPVSVSIVLPTTTTLNAVPTTLTLGQTLTLTATVTASSGGTPSGTVTFLNGAVSLGTATLNANGVATLNLTPAIGDYSITASYGGSTTDEPSASSPPIAVTVNQIATTTALQASAATLDLGQTLTLTATVTAASGATPAGSVTFLNNGATLGTASLNANGVAALTLTPAIGNYSITASYGGSTSDASSVSSPPVQVTVTTVPTTTILVANSASLTVTRPLTLTATVTATSGTTPAGTVTFLNNGTSLGTVFLNANGVATLTLTPAVGSYVLSATYSGSATDASSTSNQVDVMVSSAATSTVLAASPNPANLGQTVTLTATVTSGIGAPSGTISFYDGGTLLGQVSVTSGAAIFTTSSLSLGNHSLTAVYSGAADYVASTSGAVNEVITVPNFTISIAPSSQSVYTGESARYTVTFTQAMGISLPVLLSCSQLPANTTCAFSSDTMTQSGSSALTVQTNAPNAKSSARMVRTGGGAVLACLFLFFVPRRRGRGPLPFLVMAALLVSGTVITGCSGPLTLAGGTPVGAQTITVTATMTDGSQQFTQNATATLNVKSLY